VWALGHYLIFAAVAAFGAGLQVVVGAIAHRAGISPLFAAFAIAIPVAVFIVVLSLLNTRVIRDPVSFGLALLTAALVLATAAITPVLTLPLSAAIMVVPVALLLAYHLAAAHQGTGPTEPSGYRASG
jgi:hypothetical protein